MRELNTESLLRLIAENTGKRISLSLDDLDQYLSVARAAIVADRRARQGELEGYLEGEEFYQVGSLALSEYIKASGEPLYRAATKAAAPADAPNDLIVLGTKMAAWLYGLSKSSLPYESWATRCKEFSDAWDSAMDRHAFSLAAPSHPSEAKAGEPGPWQVLRMEDQPEPGRLLNVVLTNGVIEEGREHSEIDWTQVADWKYSRAKAGEDA